MKCNVKYCRRDSGTSAICGTCRKRKYRLDNPMKAAFQNLRSNATRRGKEFTLSFEHFKEVAIRADYIAGKGRTRESYTIDRINESLGYVDGNIQVIENHENVKKYHRHLKCNYDKNGVPESFVIQHQFINQIVL